MIAELFYPKELKNVIADLRAKGELNEAALKRMNSFVMKRVAIYIGCLLFFTFIILVIEQNIIKAFFSFSILFCIYEFCKEVVLYLGRCAILYTDGIAISGKCLHVSQNGIYGITSSKNIGYEYIAEGVDHMGVVKKVIPGRFTDNIQPMTKITVLYDKKNIDRSVPYTDHLNYIFNLKHRK